MMKKVIFCFFACMLVNFASAELKEISNTADFEKIIQQAEVPVVVKFSAYWWSSCQKLKNTMAEIAPSYSDKQVLLTTVDAYVNSDLKKYLENGSYPTVRVFYKGKVTKSSFLGNKNEEFVRNFIDGVIKNNTSKTRQTFQQLKNSKEFNKLIQESQVPVFVKFSAFLWIDCQNLKKKMEKIAPSYSEQQVLLRSVDIIENMDLMEYLDGGRAPKIWIFFKGKQTKSTFYGDQDEKFVREFIDQVIKDFAEDKSKSKSKK